MKYLECGTNSRSHILLRLNMCVAIPPSHCIWLCYDLNLNSGTNSPGAYDQYSVELFSEVTQTVCSQERIINNSSLWLCVNISLLLSCNGTGPF